jgi:preprotein translocase subunit Sss1
MSEQEEQPVFVDFMSILVAIIFGIPVLAGIGFVVYLLFSVIYGGAVQCDPTTMCQ